MIKTTTPELVATNYEGLRHFLLGQGRMMNNKLIGTATRAEIQMPSYEAPSITVFCYARGIIHLCEDKPHQVRFKIAWNTPSDRGRISQFLPADTAVIGRNYEPTLIRDDDTAIVLTKGQEYIWDSELETLLQPRTKEIFP